ncbi:MAG: biotin--[acetyl-CoA-carboxylase] ligase [Oligoflexia bacterium]|nr:biotin--[acetyl-CoA-carboxylase] ligase [Oligoflexia bacterium]
MVKIFSLSVQTQRALSHLEPQWEFLSFKNVSSTNDYAKQNIKQFTPPTLILSEHQTAGRGRGENKWIDEGHGHQFLGTWVIKLKTQPDPKWTIAIGYFAYGCLHSTWHNSHFSMKAPNDILLNNKKLGGILVEALTNQNETYLLIGLGLNVFSRPSNLHLTATSLAELKADNLDEKSWQKFAQGFAKNLSEFEAFVSNPNWLQELSPQIVVALNLSEHYKANPVRDIKPDGSVILEQGILNWLEL